MKRFVGILWVGLGLILFPLIAQAHSEGTAQLIAADIGNCQVSAWTWPDPLVTGEPAHVAVLVMEKAEAGTTGDILLDSTVEVGFVPQTGTAQSIRVPATHELADVKFFYETEVSLAAEGMWNITIFAQDASTACGGEASFAVPVVKGGGNALLWGAVAALLLIVAGLAIWQVRRRKTLGQGQNG
ncbi:MAG: hypothetical protein KA314_01160 [Chloroflexi bacterium]|nr:hypothetical protein [Chloroflexota bacterium]MBP8054415.1 hypothetical protein [Chloroflexota bacterium]